MKPYTIIKDEETYEEYAGRLEEIFDADPDSAEGMEAELLVTLISKYEEEHYPIDTLEPIEMIKEAMSVKGLKDKDLIPAIGSKPGVSQILNKKRPLTVEMIRKLSELLNLSVEVLIQPYELNGNQEKQHV